MATCLAVWFATGAVGVSAIHEEGATWSAGFGINRGTSIPARIAAVMATVNPRGICAAAGVFAAGPPEAAR
jgi:hypothetical protein